MTLAVSNDGPRPPERLDHPLTGEWVGSEQAIDDAGKRGLAVFVRSGTHSKLLS
jgi:mRNA interferase YafQ